MAEKEQQELASQTEEAKKIDANVDRTGEGSDEQGKTSSDVANASPTPTSPDGGGSSASEEVKGAAGGGLNIEDLVADNKNSKTLKCLRCGSTILRPDNATYQKKEIFLPHMKKKKANQAATDGETLSDQWRIEGMYTFENVGFTNAVNNIKYLICADCEVGPIGWYDQSDANNFYVAMERVQHE
ncbi:guanine nucleotide exchange factor MSS4-like [Anneissia japonica]|uniref:guanine nucleotide exchange factor MSS4-like n=1 Tax=Anneissia japonica TaxID=1529436 RepID=UPI0014256203|nr:guanine nucleotide exchange factor MSS4-like [Anneissia japonica]